MTTDQPNVPVALTIAGSDSGGGAGIQADLRAFRSFAVHGCSAITALTAQNPHGVRAIQAATPELLAAQIDAIFEDFDVRAVKSGMLMNAELIEVVHAKLSQRTVAYVLDPVMIATSGARLLDASAETALRALLPLATLVTPNLFEAAALLDTTPEALNASQATVDQAAQEFAARYHTSVLLKGGHLPSVDGASIDTLCQVDGTLTHIPHPLVPHPLTTHGTGCTLSSAIAAKLARGASLTEAITDAGKYIYTLLSHTVPAGRAAVYDPTI